MKKKQTNPAKQAKRTNVMLYPEDYDLIEKCQRLHRKLHYEKTSASEIIRQGIASHYSDMRELERAERGRK
jgi:hypothetical protein